MTEDLEQRVRRWLRREAADGAPRSLRHRLALTELGPAPATRWFGIPRLALVAATVGLAIILTATTLALLNQERRVGAYACDDSLVDRVRDIIAHADGYTASGTGTGSQAQPIPDPSAPGGGRWEVTMAPVTQQFAFRAPDRIDISTTTLPAGPPIHFGMLSFIGVQEVVRVGDTVRWVGWDGTVRDTPVENQIANPLLAMTLDPAADYPFAWSAQLTDATTCRLSGVLNVAAPSGGTLHQQTDIVVDLLTGEPVKMRESYDSRLDPNQLEAWDITYAVHLSALPRIELPPLATARPSPTPADSPPPS